MAHVIGLHENAAGNNVADSFLLELWKLHWLPTEIISEMYAKISSEFWESLFTMLAVEGQMSTVYHPQTDGQTERTNQVVKCYLWIFDNYDQNDLYRLLLLAEQVYTNWATNSHKMTALFANYGFHPLTEWIKQWEAHNPGATMYAHWRQDIQQQAKQSVEDPYLLPIYGKTRQKNWE